MYSHSRARSPAPETQSDSDDNVIVDVPDDSSSIATSAYPHISIAINKQPESPVHSDLSSPIIVENHFCSEGEESQMDDDLQSDESPRSPISDSETTHVIEIDMKQMRSFNKSCPQAIDIQLPTICSDAIPPPVPLERFTTDAAIPQGIEKEIEMKDFQILTQGRQNESPKEIKHDNEIPQSTLPPAPLATVISVLPDPEIPAPPELHRPPSTATHSAWQQALNKDQTPAANSPIAGAVARATIGAMSISNNDRCELIQHSQTSCFKGCCAPLSKGWDWLVRHVVCNCVKADKENKAKIG